MSNDHFMCLLCDNTSYGIYAIKGILSHKQETNSNQAYKQNIFQKKKRKDRGSQRDSILGGELALHCLNQSGFNPWLSIWSLPGAILSGVS